MATDDNIAILRKVINLLDDNVAVLDSEWRFVFVNDAMLKANKLRQADVIGKHYQEAFPWLAGTPMEKAMLGVAETRRKKSLEHQNAKTGRWYKIDIVPSDSSVIVRAADITSLKQSDALDRHLMDSLDSIDDPIFLMDRDWRYIYINLAAAKFVGSGRDEVLGQKVWEMSPWLRDTNFGRALLEAENLEEPFRVQDYYPPRDRWLSVQFFPGPHFSTVHITDITELRHSQLEITKLLAGSASTAQMHAAFDLMPHPMLMLDLDLRWTYANVAALESNARSLEEMIGTKIWELNPPLRGSELVNSCRKAFNTGQRQRVEVLLPPSERWLQVDVIPWLDQVILAAVDMTKLKQSEESVSILTETLEQAMDGTWDRPSARDVGNRRSQA